MVFRIKSTKNASLHYLLNSKQYIVGRKDCDILITDDQSISRKHAVLAVKNDHVTLTDCGSKYFTYIDGAKVEPKVEIKLESGCKIQFGQLGSFYEFEDIKIVTTTSSIKSEHKALLKDNVNFLNGALAQNWTSLCTHVTVEEIMLTVKVLCAVVKGVPIVNLQYWSDYVNNVKSNLEPPDASNYVPQCSEVILSKNISLVYNENRRTLFNNKVFIFPTKSDRLKMEDIIILSGGEAESWDAGNLTLNDVKTSPKEHLIIQVGDKIETLHPTLLDLINYNKTLGKRIIPLQEIALAIVSCSCEKDCNASFDRTGIVLAPKPNNRVEADSVILAMETQSQPVTQEQTVKNELVVPQSLENNVSIFSSLPGGSIQEQSKHLVETDNERINASIKREGDSIESFHIAKKSKNESSGVLATKSTTLNQSGTSAPNQSGASGKALFTFKQTNSGKTTSTANPINIFSKKRKESSSSDVTENVPKRPALESSLETTSSSPGNITVNPFANILKCKNKTSLMEPKIVRKKTVLKENPTFNTTIISEMNSFKLDPSKVTVVDSQMKRNYSWISKISSTETNRKTKTIDNEELAKYIESFKNSVVIEKEAIIVNKSACAAIMDNTTNTKNFKKFKKVQPLRLQTTILSERNYRNVICNDKNGNVAQLELEEESNDDEMAPVTKKTRQRKKFEF